MRQPHCAVETARPNVLTSINGGSWTPRELPVPDSLYASGYGDGVFLVAGEDGVLFQSGDLRPRLTGRPMAAGREFEIMIRGGMTGDYWLEAAGGIGDTNWTGLDRFTHDGNETRRLDPDPAQGGGAARYYRLRRP